MNAKEKRKKSNWKKRWRKHYNWNAKKRGSSPEMLRGNVAQGRDVARAGIGPKIKSAVSLRTGPKRSGFLLSSWYWHERDHFAIPETDG